MLSWPMLHTLNSKKLNELATIPALREFSNVFPEKKNPRMPLDWDIEFGIELMPIELLQSLGNLIGWHHKQEFAEMKK